MPARAVRRERFVGSRSSTAVRARPRRGRRGVRPRATVSWSEIELVQAIAHRPGGRGVVPRRRDALDRSAGAPCERSSRRPSVALEPRGAAVLGAPDSRRRRPRQRQRSRTRSAASRSTGRPRPRRGRRADRGLCAAGVDAGGISTGGYASGLAQRSSRPRRRRERALGSGCSRRSGRGSPGSGDGPTLGTRSALVVLLDCSRRRTGGSPSLLAQLVAGRLRDEEQVRRRPSAAILSRATYGRQDDADRRAAVVARVDAQAGR